MISNPKSSSQHHLEKGTGFLSTPVSTSSSPVLPLRIGVPAIALLSTLLVGWWYATSASKPASTNQAAQEKAASSETRTDDKGGESAEGMSEQHDTTLQITQSQESANAAETELQINSTPVAIPENGSVHRVIENDTGTTTVDVSVDSQTSGTNESSTSMNIEVNSSSEVEASRSNKGP